MKIKIEKSAERFLQELYTNEIKKMVLFARANGGSLEEVGRKLGVTKEFVRQAEAKITRKFALSHSGRKIRDELVALCNSGMVLNLKGYFGAHYSEMIYLLRLYKESIFYDGIQLENVSLDEMEEGVIQSLKHLWGIDDETLAALRGWLSKHWENGKQPTYDQIGKWIYDYINNEKEKPR